MVGGSCLEIKRTKESYSDYRLKEITEVIYWVDWNTLFTWGTWSMCWAVFI